MAAPKDPIVVSEEAYAVQFFSRTGLDTEAAMAAVAGEGGGSTCAAADVGSSMGCLLARDQPVRNAFPAGLGDEA